jgi:hypothetical protein
MRSWAIPTRSLLSLRKNDGMSDNPNLVACPACGGSISPEAFSCPHCGKPLRSRPADWLASLGLAYVVLAIALPIITVIVMFASGWVWRLTGHR